MAVQAELPTDSFPDLLVDCWNLALQYTVSESAFFDVWLCHSSLIRTPLFEILAKIFNLVYVFLWNTNKRLSIPLGSFLAFVELHPLVDSRLPFVCLFLFGKLILHVECLTE